LGGGNMKLIPALKIELGMLGVNKEHLQLNLNQ